MGLGASAANLVYDSLRGHHPPDVDPQRLGNVPCGRKGIIRLQRKFAPPCRKSNTVPQASGRTARRSDMFAPWFAHWR